MRPADELIDSIVNSSQVPSGKRQREIERELRAHIEDFVDAARHAGHDQDDIENLAMAHFGDPGQIAQGFAWVYRHERRTLRILSSTLAAVLLASSLFVAILAMQAGLSWGLGNPVGNMLASRHTVIEGLDILASVAAYLGLISFENLFRRRSFLKAAFLLMVIVVVLRMACDVCGVHSTFLVFGAANGFFFRAIQRFVTTKAARAGIVAISFLLAGFIAALMWAPSNVYRAATCASWLAMGAGYLLTTNLAVRVDAALLNGLERLHAR